MDEVIPPIVRACSDVWELITVALSLFQKGISAICNSSQVGANTGAVSSKVMYNQKIPALTNNNITK